MVVVTPRTRIEEFLGPADQRFFSSGYRRVDYRFGEVSANVHDGSQATLSTQASLRYPGNWSSKSGVALRPHLSTVDAIVLGVQMSELCLTRAFSLNQEQRRRMWVRSIRIKAGTAPAEQLDEVQIAARLTETRGDQDGVMASVVTTQIGTMRTRCEVLHSAAAAGPASAVTDPAGAARYADPAELLGPPGARYYGTGFSRGGQDMEDIVLDLPERAASAAVTVTPADAADQGIEGAYQPGITPVDCFVTCMQLAQVLLYELDSVKRAHSNTLWMRSTAISLGAPRRPAAERLHLATSLRDVGLLMIKDVEWRTASVSARLGAISVTCALAHQLPGDGMPPAAPMPAR